MNSTEDNVFASQGAQPEPGPEPRERTRQEAKREMVEFVKMVVWFLLLFLVLRGFVIEGYEVQGPSMEPTLYEQERILVLKLGQHWPFSGFLGPRPGDIVVFDSPDDRGKRYVKRVIAMGPEVRSGNMVRADRNGGPEPGVRLRFRDTSIYVNDRKIDQSYLAEDALSMEEDHEVLIGPDEYFVMGDNRNISKDSRNFGTVPENLLIGRALLRFWPLDRFGFVK
ncbi:MAG TPA: signal peptidase I [Candidatus Hydrogenedentes bacterium]|nr:signal peptidase I [Candidatus Hydrogenedentota bacterium]HPJ98726.1 signal peptidase I [Candidatus Hydrogenedentota bacterium]